MLIIKNIHYSNGILNSYQNEYNSTKITRQWQPQNECNLVFQAHNHSETNIIADITHNTVGFMADSGMFAMVRGHGISAFPNTILIMTEFSSGEESR